MIEMKPLTCINCGAPIDRSSMKCEYCGTQYEREYDGTNVRFVVDRPGVHTLRAEVMVDDLSLRRSPPEAMERHIMNRMRQTIADGLMEYLKMEVAQDPLRRCRIIRGEVRVLDPSWEY